MPLDQSEIRFTFLDQGSGWCVWGGRYLWQRFKVLSLDFLNVCQGHIMHERMPLTLMLGLTLGYSHSKEHSFIFWVKTEESLLPALTLGIPGDFRNKQKKLPFISSIFLATWLLFGVCLSPHFYQLSYGAWLQLRALQLGFTFKLCPRYFGILEKCHFLSWRSICWLSRWVSNLANGSYLLFSKNLLAEKAQGILWC